MSILVFLFDCFYFTASSVKKMVQFALCKARLGMDRKREEERERERERERESERERERERDRERKRANC